ncbi:hypothetical protein [Mycobacteroides abscessus]|uniref:Uncharacterized protein n=1 Tax=Mycobacteroides abscessus subsp. bolletii CRM-0020 TaxID=1306401 RepID=A0A829HMX0_9MYCO|nr:hypothetical protein [Mycobacteroides abscessus]EPQ20938.1 hypothetical protein J108_23850 [Mycobacteroides abscessus subsp. bolletii CRM-0020]SLF00925.1 Uncharacterised protein [Mycobacteroides abscessus subsp. massiliense]
MTIEVFQAVTLVLLSMSTAAAVYMMFLLVRRSSQVRSHPHEVDADWVARAIERAFTPDPTTRDIGLIELQHFAKHADSAAVRHLAQSVLDGLTSTPVTVLALGYALSEDPIVRAVGLHMLADLAENADDGLTRSIAQSVITAAAADSR